MEELKYIIEDSTIAELLGVQNFTNDEAAILELVKNAYDAKSLKVTLEFTGDQLDIKDNGIGMDAEDIKKHWMHIGKSNKEYEIIDDNNNKRIQAGSKGVGRFALSRLGRHVCLHTKKDNSDGVIWETDWNHSTLEYDMENDIIGTQIIISGLREKWTKKRISNLCIFLEKTYNDTSMEIEVVAGDFNSIIPVHFPVPKAGMNCRSNITLEYSEGILTTKVFSDEFQKDAKVYCPDVNIEEFSIDTDILKELKGSDYSELVEDLADKLKEIGSFRANFFFNLTATNVDREKFLYKYLDTPQSIESGIILYRNAFSISSYEGKKDWLGLGKRSRKSPAAASHPTGAWRVRENQLAGYVQIDKKENKVLQDLANRQGLDENIYYQLFVEIILTGIKEFERYRQGIIRKINIKNKEDDFKITPITDKIIKNPNSIYKLTKDESIKLSQELKVYKQEGNQYKRDKDEIEARYKYDVRILNVLATTGLKASSIAHEMKNDRNTIADSYENIVTALKEYNMWEELNEPENTRKSYKNVPYLLKSNNDVGKKIVQFMDTMLSEIEKKQFEAKWQSVADILNNVSEVWERDYAWVDITIEMDEDIIYCISEDIVHVILDNLILNSVQQNDSTQHLNVKICVCEKNGLLKFTYKDDGKGLDKKYITNPRKILEVHETTRANGHGLGMWIVNNTCVMSGGEIQDIVGEKGFYMEFTIGGKL